MLIPSQEEYTNKVNGIGYPHIITSKKKKISRLSLEMRSKKRTKAGVDAAVAPNDRRGLARQTH